MTNPPRPITEWTDEEFAERITALELDAPFSLSALADLASLCNSQAQPTTEEPAELEGALNG